MNNASADDTPDSAPLFVHQSVLAAAVLTGLAPKPHGYYLDVTVGGGGHSRLILETDPTIRLLALDQDPVALEAARQNLAEFGDRVLFWQGNFASFNPAEQKFDGVLADLGVSSPQLDRPERGFSFRHQGALDMRMDTTQELTAAELVNHSSERELADIFYHYGEERLSRRIARRIVERRPFQTTTALADAIAASVPGKYRHGRIHPATRVFQALRIAVNRELEVLEQLIEVAPDWLAPGGKLAIISFHSLEDRRVKHGFRDHGQLKILTKKPIIAGEDEIRQNPRARSAKLRLAERIE
ncbi:16S rRNA (cytosine(1402)-N(4))-methyltransferase RsmH [Leptolyngbya cf. ectocarpi LEGE 11479]|uniref:Ribosomal RNA small subunit methyltransferase H n=1 Tax=Leptolyngbya cf. ectocarpi LEGE 11479 TaxID=1828722 RepID=A0A929F8D6_LEPEC|nr:16S rRNA (cytosine(1402)-N(4))-methyltransferase RsmH [Leptolyngbya ectocarpi]MBE9068766.1 16S rRNA (cytosine(1402)-N(4))-methyltransferase RsmH [Leptolyngbya cf. ectocarpi LEGE 11479]